MTANELARLLDHSVLKPEATEVDIRAGALVVREWRIGYYCVQPTWVRMAVAALAGQGPDRGKSIHIAKLAAAPQGVPAELPISLLGRRPDVVAARLLAQASASEVSAAKAEFYPDVNLSAFAGFWSLGMGELLKQTDEV